MQRKARPVTGSSSECFEVSGLEGEKQNSEKGDTWGRDNTTHVDRQLASDVRVFSGTSEQVMSGAARQVMSVLGFCEKSCPHLSPNISIEHGGSISHGPKGPTSQGPKGFISQGSLSIKASLDKNEKDSLIKKSAASTIKDGMIFQAKVNEKGKQILGKGSLKKVARAKGKASDDQTLVQMMEIGTKRLRGKEASEEKNTWAQKSFCETVKSGLTNSVLEPV